MDSEARIKRSEHQLFMNSRDQKSRTSEESIQEERLMILDDLRYFLNQCRKFKLTRLNLYLDESVIT